MRSQTTFLKSWNIAFVFSALLAAAASTSAGDAPALPQFRDVTESAGIKFKHSIGDFDLSNIVEATGPGVLVFDFNKDGYPDLFFVNGRWHPDISDNRGRTLKGKLHNVLYRNNGDGTFTDVTERAGVGGPDDAYGMGASWADYDNDGWPDLYVFNYGRNILYHNNGDGTFTDVTEKSGLASPGWTVAAPWFDWDGDGYPDVFVCHYLEYDKGAFQRTGAYYKADNFPGPLGYPGLPDRLYRNNHDGTFTDVTKEAGLWEPTGRGMGAVAVDIDGDGSIDIFVTNDAMPNNCWINDGKGHFTDKAEEMGVAYGEGGQGVSHMGPFLADVDHNGFLDVLIPDMGYSCLLSQTSARFFKDVTTQSGVALLCGQYTGWGGLLCDYDNDGWLDIFVANGDPHHLYPEEAVLARNNGKGKFIDVAKQSGDFFNTKHVARGAAVLDYDNDGRLDIVIAAVNEAPHLLHNEGRATNNWLTVVPVRKDTGLIAIGSVVTAHVNGVKMLDPVISANGYLSGSDPRAHFGLGTVTNIDSIEIRWADGKTKVLKGIKPNQFLTVKPD